LVSIVKNFHLFFIFPKLYPILSCGKPKNSAGTNCPKQIFFLITGYYKSAASCFAGSGEPSALLNNPEPNGEACCPENSEGGFYYNRLID
jgi:hypothetical protein